MTVLPFRSHASRTTTSLRDVVLVVGEDNEARDPVSRAVEEAGWILLEATTEEEALASIGSAPPSLVVLVGDARDRPPLELLDALRADQQGAKIPVVIVLRRRDRAVTLDAFGRRADDVVAGRVSRDELIARLRVRLDRRPLPRSALLIDPATGAFTPEAIAREIDLELERALRGNQPGALAYLALDELPSVEARFGPRARNELLAQVVRLVQADGRQLDFVGLSRGLLVILLPGTPAKGAQIRLERLSRLLHQHEFVVGGIPIRVTPLIGWAIAESGLRRQELDERAWTAMMHEAEQLDLHPTRWRPAMSTAQRQLGRVRGLVERFRTPLQVAFQQLLCLGLPFGLYVALERHGIDITGVVYLGIVAALCVTAALMWVECLAAMNPPEPPELEDGATLPRATAVIAAYLPNEADTIVDTVMAFLAHDYPDLQVILAYNTPHPLPVERRLQAIAAADRRFEAVRVEGSVSKAQNVNVSLSRVRGEFVGLFDADHHPAPGSFVRAWRWLANGADIVQGHCVVRNGEQNRLTRIVAAEFEVMYGLSHPGRARMHGFGIFGGSNGFWRTDVLEKTRLRGFMLTEDIDSSLRVVSNGGRIVSDPGLVSTELAPDTATALWNQRMRWAQGWSQVSLRHLLRAVRRPLTLRQRLGVLHLLGWREAYPWISLQVLPIFAFWFQRGHPPIDWFIPVFVFTTAFTLSAGPVQAWFAWRLSHPTLKENPRWFWVYAVVATLVYTEVKNVIARTAHIKEAMRERKWKVTPRAIRPATGALGRADVFDAESAVA